MGLTFDNIKTISERMGWIVEFQDEDREATFLFQRTNSYDEDYTFLVTGKTEKEILYEIQNEAIKFSIDDRVYLWLSARRSGIPNIPSVDEILESAKEIKLSLINLSSNLNMYANS